MNTRWKVLLAFTAMSAALAIFVSTPIGEATAQEPAEGNASSLQTRVGVLEREVADLKARLEGLLGLAPKPSPASAVLGKIAMVDMDRLIRDSRLRTVADTRLGNVVQEHEGRINRRSQMGLLTEAEHHELDSLLEKPTNDRSRDENARVEALTAKSTWINEKFDRLSKKPSNELSAEERQTLASFRQRMVRMQESSDILKVKQREELAKFMNSEVDGVWSSVRMAVRKVATSKGVTAVLTIPQMGPDLTAEVIAELNRTK